MYKVTHFLFLLFIPCTVWSQHSITGKVKDVSDDQPLGRAHVYLYTMEDRFVKIATTSDEGIFLLERISSGSYRLKVSFIGYHSQEKEVRLVDRDLDLGAFEMVPEKQVLDEVSVTENIRAATIKGDTIQFNADAYTTMPDASAQDLVEKLPGVVVDGNAVQAQGEEVKEVLVDGRSFFGYDASTALNTLPAEVVEKIQIFDRESDQAEFTGFSTGQTTKTMNIITRARMRNGSFGKVSGGYGTGNTYMVNGNYNIFDGERRISLIGQTNNINQQNFAFEDLMGILAPSGGGRSMRRGGGPGGGGRMGMGGGINAGSDIRDFMVNRQGGISNTNAGGINYSDKWGEKFEISGSYFFNLTDNMNEEISYRQYLLAADSGQVYNEIASSESRNINHRFNARLEYAFNENTSLLVRPRITYQSNSGFTGFEGTTSLSNMLQNKIENRKESELDAYSVDNTLLLRHKFAEKGRTISLNIANSWNRSGGESFLLNTTQSLFPSVMEELTDQYSRLGASGWGMNARATYTEPAGENILLSAHFAAGYQENLSEKETWNFSLSTGEYALFDTLLSNTFNNDHITQKPGAAINYRNDRLIITAGADYQFANLVNYQQFPIEFTLEKTYHNLLFNGMIRYGKSRMNSVVARYFSSVDLPSVSQLQDVIDNSDPLQLTKGNPDLDNSYLHRLFLRYSRIQSESSRIFFAMLALDARQNHIGNSTFIARSDTLLPGGLMLNEGTQLTSPVNLDGYLGLRSFVTYGIPLEKLRMNMNFNLSGGWTRTPALVDETLNFSNSYSASGGVVLSSNISERIDFTLTSRTGIHRVVNSLSAGQDVLYLNQQTGLRFKWIFYKGLLFESSFDHSYYSGLNESLDPSYFILNAGIGTKLFKSQLGEIKLTVNDALNENQSLQRTVSDIYIEDTESMVLQRFLMLTFTYHFRNFDGEMPVPGRLGPPPGVMPGAGPGRRAGMGTGPGGFE